ncbi:hypothetical protein PybrP1_002535, partial [[Pythium] brassicae (nom. inval.)]
MTLITMPARLLSELQLSVSTCAIHRSLTGMLYSMKGVCIEKSTRNSTKNKRKGAVFATCLAARSLASMLTSSPPPPRERTCTSSGYLAVDGSRA